MNESERVRTFIALEVPEDVKRAIRDVQERLKRIAGARVSWVRSEGVHLTLKFLGDVESSSMPLVEEVVIESAAGIGSFDLSVGRTGGFPNLKKPRVLWVGIDRPAPLMQLQQDIERGMAGLGFPKEGKRFHPHLTVGRVKAIERSSPLADTFAASEFPRCNWRVDEVRVMSSILKPGGAEYDVIANIRLGRETADRFK